MKYIRHVIAMAIAAACFCGAHAGDVTSEMAVAAAEAWMAANPSFGTTGSAISAVAEYDGDTILWWTVATSSGGAVFISPETSIDPVLAAVPQYSGSLPAAHPLRAILKADVANRRSVIAAATAAPQGNTRLMAYAASPSGAITNEAVAAAVEAAEGRWAKYTTPKSRLMSFAAPPAGVTVFAEVPGFGEAPNDYLRFWNQEEYPLGNPCFNLYTPENAVCGCVATAGAALLQYFGCPGLEVNVKRECSYNGAKVSLTTISATNRLDWSILPVSMGGTNTAAFADEQTELLGRAAYDVGVCVKMEYTSGESGAKLKDLASALKDDFGFMAARYVELGTNGNFSSVYEDLCRTNPVALGIRTSQPPFGGHAVLAVGYGEDADTNRYTRLFMGWGGKNDAWYNLPDIQAGSHSFDIVDDAIVSILFDPPLGAHRTIEDAKTAALENHKPLLVISGTIGDADTTALLGNLAASGNLGNFEIYFADYNSDPHGDQNPCYGVFNPLAFAENRWAFYNGSIVYSAEPDNITNNVAVAALLDEGLDGWETAYTEYVHQLDASTNGIVVTTANSVNLFCEQVVSTVEGEYDDPDWYEYIIDPRDGDKIGSVVYKRDKNWTGGALYENAFTNGETVVINAMETVLTNDTVVWECAGWILKEKTVSEDGDVDYESVVSGVGTTATFTVAANTTYELRWLWDPSAVLLTTACGTGGRSVSPDGDTWQPYASTATVVATPRLDANNWQVGYWTGDTDGCVASSNAIAVLMDRPRSVTAYFTKKNSSSVALTISSDPADVRAGVFSGDGKLFAYGENWLSTNTTISLQVPDVWQDEAGNWWSCTNWYVTGCCETNGTNTVAKFDLTGDAVLTWQWEPIGSPVPPSPPTPVVPAETPVGPVVGGVTNSAIAIYPTNSTQLAVEARVSNAVAGYWYSIGESSSVTGTYSFVSGAYTGTAKKKADDPAPELLSFVIVFDPAEASKFYRVVVTEEEPE